jgi:predicted Zn-dependent protease
MKPVWNPLLIALNLVILSTGTPVVLAEPTAPVKETPSVSATETKTSPVSVPTQTPKNQTPPLPAKPTSNKQPTTADKLTAVIRQRQILIEADRLYLGRQIASAEKLYREVKTPFAAETEPQKRAEPILDPAQLPPAGKVYWREAQAGAAQKLQTRMTVPLQLLVEQYPQFIPGQMQYASLLEQSDRRKEAIEVLERATTLYPEQPELVKAKVATLAKAKKWMEASLAARQFAVLNSNPQNTAEFTQLADANLNRYRKHLRREIRGNAIANLVTGVLGYAVTGSLFGPLSAVQTSTMLLRGESSVGNSVAKDARKQLPLVEDKVVVDYVNEIGQKIAKVAGRNEFKYEFYVVLEDNLNAFALPGGKVFVNAGAIARTDSEAELAGLIAHELSHAVLSHGFQLATEGNLVANVTQYVPYGGTVANLFALNYSRDMERQADTLGTRLIVSSGYAADGLRNLMVTLKQQEKSSPPSWLSSHPGTNERIRDLETLIERNRYNRYAYEGVARHAQIKAQAEKLLIDKELQAKKKHHR